MDPTLLLLSALGVVAVTLVARAMGFAATPLLDEARARAEAERVPGFRAAAVRLAEDRRSALVAGPGGRIVAVLPLGDRFVARAIAPGSLREEKTGRVVIDFAEPMLGRRRFSLARPDRQTA